MKQQWQQLLQKLNALNRRERVMVFVAVLALLFFVLNQFLLSSLLLEQKKLRTQVADDQKKLAMYVRQLQEVRTTQISDPDAINRQQLQTLAVQQQALDQELHKMQDTLVSPEQMAKLLEDILRSNQRLTLLTVKTLSPEEIEIQALPDKVTEKTTIADNLTSATNADASEVVELVPKVVIYQHGVELVVTGGYLELLAALKKIEALPWNLRWGKLALTSEQYPEAKLTLIVHTLSMDKTWLSL